MSNENRIIALTEADISDVQTKAHAKLLECQKANDVIGAQIFSILGLYARVIYYPLDADGPWGFTLMKDSDSIGVNETDKPFVAINTSILTDKQAFAAAHELYHIWYERKADYIPASILNDVDEHGFQLDKPELRANRFAAEFLVAGQLLKQEMQIYSIHAGKVSEKNVLKLAELFSVPYRTMVKRLNEIGAIDEKQKERFLAETDESIEIQRKRYSITIPEADGRVAIDNLVELSVAMYEAHRITYEKLQYLLSLSNLTPADVGIDDVTETYIPPDDTVLDEIMEE
ncbi:MAG: ImmA/IrrE family metallo-endopeptidase [Clostridia bacterium]